MYVRDGLAPTASETSQNAVDSDLPSAAGLATLQALIITPRLSTYHTSEGRAHMPSRHRPDVQSLFLAHGPHVLVLRSQVRLLWAQFSLVRHSTQAPPALQ